MLRLAPRAEQIHLRLLPPRDGLDGVEGRLCEITFDAVDHRDHGGVAYADHVGGDADQLSVPLVEIYCGNMGVAAADVPPSPEFGVSC